ncbi:hypothetical protein SULAR_03992 [Sulfurovum sp. AR]|nr:hypothetical protein SULAR_03992 [Sulfurovum sp. AR]
MTPDNPYFNINNCTIKFDKINSATSSKYTISSEKVYISERTSNPDYILGNDDKIIIIDAKWKIFENNSDKSCGLKIEDVIKLQRDVELRKDPNVQKEIYAALVYPKVLDSYKNRIFKMKYPFNNDVFNFKVIEIPYS